MSQSQSRRGPRPIGKRVEQSVRKLNAREIKARALKMQYAAMVKMGFIAVDQPKELQLWAWTDGSVPIDLSTQTVLAHTKSEAKSLVKRACGISKNKRLPKGYTVERRIEDV